MGKKKQKKKEQGEKAKLPKNVAGVKVPKALRDAGGKLLETVQQPVVLEIAAAALVAAAQTLREGQRAKETSGDQKAANGGGGGSTNLKAILTAAAVEGIRKAASGKSGKKA